MKWLAALLLLLSLVAMAPLSAAEELQTTIWDEDFANCSDWTLAADMACTGGALHAKVFTQTFGEDVIGDGNSHSLGPTYRSAAGSTWDKTAFVKLKLNATTINTGDPGTTAVCNGTPCKNIRIWDFVIANGVAAGISTEDDAFLLRRTDNFVEGSLDLHQFEVYQSDDGTQTLVAQHDIGTDSSGKDMDFNFTLAPQENRYWINWSCPACSVTSGSITQTWTDTGDGWETESSIYQVTIFNLGENSMYFPDNGTIGELHLYGLGDEPLPPPPPPPPAPHNPLKPDFAYQTGELGTQFYDRSVSPSEIIAWNWSFGDTYGSKRQHPFHSYACKGTYHVQLWVEDANGEKANVSADIVIADDRPLCGVIQRSEQGLTIVPGASVTIPTLFFGLLATISASTLAFGIDFNWRGRELISRKARVALLAVSVFFLLLQFGYLGFLEAVVV